jgi:hypothetical protein
MKMPYIVAMPPRRSMKLPATDAVPPRFPARALLPTRARSLGRDLDAGVRA